MDTNHAIVEFINYDTEEVIVSVYKSKEVAEDSLRKIGYKRCLNDWDEVPYTYKYVWENEANHNTYTAIVYRLELGEKYGEVGSNDWDELEKLAKKSWEN